MLDGISANNITTQHSVKLYIVNNHFPIVLVWDHMVKTVLFGVPNRMVQFIDMEAQVAGRKLARLEWESLAQRLGSK